MRLADKFYKLKVRKADWKKCQNDIEMNTLVFSESELKLHVISSHCYYIYLSSVFKNFYYL